MRSQLLVCTCTSICIIDGISTCTYFVRCTSKTEMTCLLSRFFALYPHFPLYCSKRLFFQDFYLSVTGGRMNARTRPLMNRDGKNSAATNADKRNSSFLVKRNFAVLIGPTFLIFICTRGCDGLDFAASHGFAPKRIFILVG